jgi:glycosyltransferase involved in cell wall biosynthesis
MLVQCSIAAQGRDYFNGGLLMNERPMVSVIIPTYNRAEILRQAIISVLHQTFQDFEIIVIDDSSHDATFDVVHDFDDIRIKYLSHKINKGGSAARNTGIANAVTEYIAFLDDDDEWLPFKLEKQMQLMVASPSKTGAIYTGYVLVDRVSGKIVRQKIPAKNGDLYHELLKGNPVGGTSCVLLRKACFEKVGIFDEELPSFQDYDMWIRIAKEYHFDYIGESMLKYYIHDTRIWTNLDALNRGIEIMLKRYGESHAFRRKLSCYYLYIGVRYCREGRHVQGREACLKAIELNPFVIKYYLMLWASYLDRKTLKILIDLKEKISDCFRVDRLLSW